MILRVYEPTDCMALTELFYETVHAVNAADYTMEQLNAWATGEMDLERWNATLTEHSSLVAVWDGRIVGFGDMDKSGYLDRLYVHKDYQRCGIATAICDRLEGTVTAERYVTHASITAKPFFEKRGYTALKKQEVERGGILLTNYVMAKQL